MITINTVLPVYDRLIKQCYERSKCAGGGEDMIVPVITDRYRLPSMQWNVGTDDPGELVAIELIDQNGVITDITDYFNRNDKYAYQWVNDGTDGYDTFTSNVPPAQAEITACTKTTAGGEAIAGLVLAFGLSTSEVAYDYSYQPVRVDVTLTLNSGTAPKIELRDYTTWNTAYSNTVTLVEGRNTFFLTPTGTSGTTLSIVIYNSDGESCNFTMTHNNIYGINACHPRLYTNSDGDEYFMYNELTSAVDAYLKYALEPGIYYLRFTSLNGYVYYSDYFKVECVYTCLTSMWTSTTYTTFVSDGSDITSAIHSAPGSDYAYTNQFYPVNGEDITVIFNLQVNTGQMPGLYWNDSSGVNQTKTLINGLNVFTFTAPVGITWARIYIYNDADSNWELSDFCTYRDYSENYLKFVFSHSCNLGELIYEDDFEQILYLESETMEPVFPYVEKGQENGQGLFIPIWQRQDKNYVIKTLLIPQFLVDVLHRLKLHDSITLTDLVGDTHTVRDIEVEHEWQFDDKYYALATITVGLGEEIIVTGCCTAIDDCV